MIMLKAFNLRPLTLSSFVTEHNDNIYRQRFFCFNDTAVMLRFSGTESLPELQYQPTGDS